MPTRAYAIEEGGPARVELHFAEPARDVRVLFDGKEVARAADEAALRAEPVFDLPDGSVLRLGLEGASPKLSRNGGPLHEPGTDRAAANASRILYFVAALTAALSLLAIATRSEYLALMRLGYVTLAASAVYALCGFLTSRRSWVALAVGTALFASEGFLHAVRAVGSEQGAPLWPVILRLFLLVALGRALVNLRVEARR